jgi:hypothetical protein
VIQIRRLALNKKDTLKKPVENLCPIGLVEP